MPKVCWDSQTLAFQGPVDPVPVVMRYWEDTYWEHTLQLLSYKLSLKVTPAVWISIENTHTDRHCPLFSR